jgi:3-carboxy-cis,cis-muconate cycloisomerase
MSELTDLLFGAPAVDAAFSDRARLAAMLTFEAALARAQAQVGVIPAAAADPIAAACEAKLYALPELASQARQAGNLAIPLVKMLTAQVAKDAPEAAPFVHWGATSQDVIDTGLCLQIAQAGDALAADQQRIERALTTLAHEHAQTLMAGRTLLQHAIPITFGLKVAGWLDSVRFGHGQVTTAVDQAVRLQFGGAAGTLASLEDRGLEVSRALATQLQLPEAPAPWHARRERIAALGAALALQIGVLGKIATDLVLMMQTEAAEAFEPAANGKGGSSAMPHKRNPVGLVAIRAAAVRAPGLAASLLAGMAQEHERSAGGWHAEWEVLPELFRLAGGAALHAAEILEGLELDPARMRANLDMTQGLPFAEAVTMALIPSLGRAGAHALVEVAAKAAVTQRRHLKAVLSEDAQVGALLSATALEDLFDPARRLGAAAGFIGRVLGGPA